MDRLKTGSSQCSLVEAIIVHPPRSPRLLVPAGPGRLRAAHGLRAACAPVDGGGIDDVMVIMGVMVAMVVTSNAWRRSLEVCILFLLVGLHKVDPC